MTRTLEFPLGNRQKHSTKTHGFALIMSMLILGFIVLLMLSLSALVSLETHNATQAKAQLAARKNAEFALFQALGKLQQYAGPDQRITASAKILEPGADPSVDYLTEDVSQDKKHWIGVWNTKDFNASDTTSRIGRNVNDKTDMETGFLGWLVSGSNATKNLDVMTDATIDFVDYDSDTAMTQLVGEGTVNFSDESDSTRNGVRVPKVALPSTSTFAGNYAYWVGDESTKARINLTNPYDDELKAGDWQQRRTNQSIALRHGIEKVISNEDINFSSFYTDFSEDAINRIYSSGDLLAASNLIALDEQYQEASRSAFYDVTPYSTSVLADVKNGGLKKDLSLAFEISDEAFQDSSLINSEDYNRRNQYFGGANTEYIGDPNKKLGFLYMEDTGTTHPYQVVQNTYGQEDLIFRGPTWQLLRNYYRLYRKVDNPDTTPSILAQAHRPNRPDGVIGDALLPAVEHDDYGTNPGENSQNWDNYRNSGGPVLRAVEPQIAPILLRSTYLFSIRRDSNLEIGLGIDYVGVLYNPYDVTLEFPAYKALLQSMPLFLKFSVWKPQVSAVDGSIYYEDEATTTYGYYGFEYFLLGNIDDISGSIIYDADNPIWGNFILTSDGTETPSGNVRMAPGEVRLFSLNNSSPQDADKVSLPAKFGWNNQGGLFFRNLNLGQQPVWSPGNGQIPTSSPPQTVTLNDDDLFTVHVWNNAGGNMAVYEFNGSEPNRDAGGNQTNLLNGTKNPPKNDYRYRTIQGHVFSSALVDSDAPNLSLSFQNPQSMQDHILSVNQLNHSHKIYHLKETDQFFGSELNSKHFFAYIDLYFKPTHPQNQPLPILSHFNLGSYGGWQNTMAGRGTDRAGLPNWDVEIDELDGSSNGIIESANTSGSAFWGNSISQSPAADEQSQIVLFNVPTTPMTSLGSFQHVNAGVTPDHPTYVIGNSYATPYVTTASVWEKQFNTPGATSGRYANYADVSYLANDALWDGYFFSGLNASAATSFTSESAVTSALEANIQDFVNGKSSNLNPHVVRFLPEGEDNASMLEQLSDINTGSGASDEEQGLDKAAAFMMQKGSFNINSTSIEAWKALLKGLNTESVEVTNTSGSITTETTLDAALFSRTTLPAGNDSEPWRGYNTLSDEQLTRLAERIVEEVKTRGPFISVADFVNRRLVDRNSPYAEQGLKGTLQAALDDTATDINSNSDLTGKIDSIATASSNAFDTAFPYDNFTENTGSASPGFLMQADVLSAIGPYLTARGDTFIIRAYGDATNPLTGEVISQAWCEAVVQRYPDYSNPDETKPYQLPDGLSTTNETFGRQFRIVSFRWLNENEV